MTDDFDWVGRCWADVHSDRVAPLALVARGEDCALTCQSWSLNANPMSYSGKNCVASVHSLAFPLRIGAAVVFSIDVQEFSLVRS